MNDLPELSGPVGSRLRQAREAQGISVQFVSERLKFSVRQVEALEAGQFSLFPHRAQVRGFVRAYARLLLLPETELLGMVEAEVPPDTPTPGRPALKGAVLVTPHRPRWPMIMTLLVVGMLVFMGGSWLMYGWLQMSHLTQPPVPENQLLLESDLVLPDAASVAAASAADISATPASAAVTASSVASAAAIKNARMVLSFSDTSWVEVLDARGVSRYRAMGQPRQQVPISGQEPFRITVGKAGAVKIMFAGQPVDLKPYTRGEVARLTLPPVR